MLPRPGLEEIVGFQAENLGKDGFAVCRRLVGEFVRSALEQEGRVDEGLIVHAHGPVDFGLGLAYCVAREGDGVPAGERLQLDVGGSLLPPAASLDVASNHAVGLCPGRKIKLDAAFLGPKGNQCVLRPGPSLSP